MTASTTDSAERDALRQDCWDGALYTFGTSHIFQERARHLKRKLQLLTYSGIVLPLMIGTTALSFGLDFPLLGPMIVVAAILLIGQLAVSAWGLVAGWVDNYTYANDSATANDELARRYEALAKNPPPGADFRVQYDLVDADDNNRKHQDLRRGLGEKEKRKGMRAALRRYQRKCAGCQQVPSSLKPTDCDICGNF